MKFHILNKIKMRVDHGYIVFFGVQWSTYDVSTRVFKKRLSITLFGIDFEIEGKAATALYKALHEQIDFDSKQH